MTFLALLKCVLYLLLIAAWIEQQILARETFEEIYHGRGAT